MVREEEKHDKELDENEEVTEEQEPELVLGMVEVNYENEEPLTGEQLPLQIVNTDHDQNNDEQHVEERTVQLEAVGNLDCIYSSVQSKLKYYHFIIPDSSPKPVGAIKKSYYIQTFYIRKKPRNEWLTKVITTKKLDALLEVSYLIIYSLLLYLNFYPETMRVYIYI